MKALSPYQKKTLFILICANLALLTVSVIYAHIIASAEGEDIVSCAVKHLLHIYCPGCGGSRSLVSLFRLDLISAFTLYPPMAILLFFLIDIDVRATLAVVRNERGYLEKFKLTSVVLIPLVMLICCFVRNYLLICHGVDPIGDLIGYYS